MEGLREDGGTTSRTSTTSMTYFAVHVRSPRRPLADGRLARISYRVRRGRHRHARHDGRGRAALAGDGARDLSGSRAALGAGHRDSLRRRGGLGNGAVVRAGAPVAGLHGLAGSIIGMPFSLEGFAFFT